MRFVFLDLHCNDFYVRTLQQILNRTITVAKHRFLLNYLIDNGYEVVNYVTGTRSGSWVFKDKLWAKKLEKNIVYKNNQLSHRIVDIYDANEIMPDDIVIIYSLLDYKIDIKSLKGRKYVNVNHFFNLYSPDGSIYLPDFLENSGMEGYIAETNIIQHSAFFREFFQIKNKKMIIMSYVASDRFRNEVPFEKRRNVALACGSLSIYSDLFSELYGTKCLHPMREEIFNRSKENDQAIYSIISRTDPPKQLLNYNEKDRKIVKFVKRFINHFYHNYKSPVSRKSKGYYSLDMVKLLNEHKMFIWPEEVTGLPAQGFVEGMRCGCAYFGIENGIYECLGMKVGVHYVGYNGTYDDLLEKIHYYQNHDEELERIAKNGQAFAESALSCENVSSWVVKQLEEKNDEY